MKLFLDDEREALFVHGEANARNWVVVRSVSAAKEVLSTGEVTEISLDHDLGADLPTGYDLAKWMTEKKLWPAVVYFHSMNPVGVHNMMAEHNFYLTRVLGEENEEDTSNNTD